MIASFKKYVALQYVYTDYSSIETRAGKSIKCD